MPKVRKAVKYYQNKTSEQRKRDKEIKQAKRESAVVTPGERVLSDELKKRGVKHYTQVPIGRYIGDIVIVKNGKTYLVEVEGKSHDTKIEYDKKRQDEIEKREIEVIRISERDARDPKTADTVLNTIRYLEEKKAREEEARKKRLRRFQ